MTPDNANKQLTDLLISKNFEPHSLDAKGQPAANPEDATMFSFDYQGESGKDYGTVVMMIDEEHNLNVYFGDNLGKGMEGDDKKQWFDFLYQVRQFAKRNMMTFSLQNLNKLKYSMQGQAAIKEGLFESWAGRRNMSWNAAATEARLVIKHKKNLGEGEARFRYIESLFIETQDGERYRMPFKSLTAGKAMLEHVRQGGKPYDIRGNHISTIVEELNLLSRFRRANQGKIFEGDAQQLVEEATHYFEALKQNLKTITSRTGYKKYFESWNPAALTDEDVIIEDLRHLFVEQNIDTRVEQALPLLAKLKQEHAMKEINVFESMMTLITEGTWALPDTPEKQSQLIKLLSAELPVGPDATNATELLYDLLGDDDLFDQLGDLAREDANADARTIVINKLEQMKSNPAVAQVIGKLKVETTPQAEPEQPVDEGYWAQQGNASRTSSSLDGRKHDTDYSDLNSQSVGYRPSIKEEELCETCHQDVCECGTYESTEMDLDEQIDRIFELSRDTLKSYIRKASSSGEENSASNLSSRAAHKLASGDEDDGEADDHKSYMRSKGISRAVDKLEEDQDGSPVESAIINRIMRAHPDLLSKFGPEAIMNAARDQAEYVGDVDEIGSSDISAYVAAVVRDLESSQVTEISDKTVQNYKEKAWDEFARGNDKRGAGIGRALDKQRGAPGHVKTTGQDDQLDELSPNTLGSYVKKASSDRAIRNFDQGFDTGKSFDQREPDFDADNARRDDSRRKGIGRAVNRLTQEEYQELSELSPDTLKNYIKKAGMSAVNKGAEIGQKQAAADEVDRYTNRHFPKGTDQYGQRDAMRKAVGADYDDINKTRSKAQKRVAGIGRAADRLGEASDTVEKDAEGKVKSWKHDGDWKKIPKSHGKAKDPRGEVTNLAGRELQKAKNLKESGMSEVDLLLQEIARGNVDIMDIYANPKTNIEMFVQEQLHEKAEQMAREQNLDLEGDIDDILQRIQRELEVEYGTDDNMDIEMETVGGGNFLESSGDRTALTGQYGHSGKMSAVEGTDADMMERIKFLAGLTK
jgi:hypothetical protein